MVATQSTPTMAVAGVIACGASAGLLAQGFVQTPQLRGAPAQADVATVSEVPTASHGTSALPTSGAMLGVAAAGAIALAATRTRVGSRNTTVIVPAAYDASKEIGASDPLLFWDPIGFCTEDCTKEDFDRRRAVEIKHGRICMLATIGMVWPDIFGKFDGDLSPSLGLKFSDIPSGLGAITAVPIAGWVQILFFAGLIETQLFKDPSLGGFGVSSYGAEPGNFGTGYWGRKIKDPAERRLKLTTELNNGRLAMVAFTGMALQNLLTGQSPIEQLSSGHISPFNDGQGYFAFDPSKELGACSPLGYWDPFGMMAFQDEEKFRRNRELELKHGRVCMVATIGMVVPDLFGKFPGYLSPSAGIKFEDIPSSVYAVYKVPFEGWLQIFAVAGLLEAKNLYFPTNYGYPPFLGSVNKLDAATKEKKLLAEINNGRLAMVAMAAMVAQNGVTGQSLIEQFSKGNLNPWIGGYAKSDSTALQAAGKSIALPWSPVPVGLTNKQMGGEYIGDVGFDPAGFAKNKRLLPWYREAELAHGRVCMLAVLGINVQAAGFKIEPFVTRYPTSSEDPLTAATQVPFIGWLQIVAVIGLSELWRYENVISKYGSGVKPGDLGWNPQAPVKGTRPKWFGPTFEAKYTQEEFELMQLRELKHGRLAMVGFFFTILQNAADGVAPTIIPDFDGPEYARTVGDFIPKNI
ncbi:Light-harvesting complex [Amphidinium carterae]